MQLGAPKKSVANYNSSPKTQPHYVAARRYRGGSPLSVSITAASAVKQQKQATREEQQPTAEVKPPGRGRER